MRLQQPLAGGDELGLQAIAVQASDDKRRHNRERPRSWTLLQTPRQPALPGKHMRRPTFRIGHGATVVRRSQKPRLALLPGPAELFGFPSIKQNDDDAVTPNNLRM